jgi:hypothetical protein
MRRTYGLLDTGADESELPMALATRLGIKINSAEPARFRGVGGEQAKGFYGENVDFELWQQKRSFRWIVPKVAFLYEPDESSEEQEVTIVLGHVGFFRFFNADFDYQRGRVSVRPNGHFRPYAG